MMAMNKKILCCLLGVSLLFTGCGKEKKEEGPKITTEAVIKEPVAGDAYDQYTKAVEHREQVDDYTITVKNSYTMYYADGTMSAYDMDEVFQKDDDTAHLKQNIDSNGMRQTFDGYYYNGRLYNSYNNITYYEDMDLNSLFQSMLVPVTPIVFHKDMTAEVQGGKDSDGNISYNITLAKDHLLDIFKDRYDRYGLDQYDDLQVKQGIVTETFNDRGVFIGEDAMFDTKVSLQGQDVRVVYRSSVDYVRLGTTTVELTEEQKKEQASYVNFKDIDVSKIETYTSDDDSPEKTVEETFKKRLVNRLGYKKQEDGKYASSYNNNNESYTVDFDLHIFEYSNRSIHYIYNWKSDTGQMGACSLDFDTDVQSSECKSSTADAIRDTKSWFEMELYYCGLTLSDLQAEANK